MFQGFDFLAERYCLDCADKPSLHEYSLPNLLKNPCDSEQRFTNTNEAPCVSPQYFSESNQAVEGQGSPHSNKFAITSWT